MAEWLLLLLLVPAIVVPVVLLGGFAGCSFERGTSPPTPIIASAIGHGLSAITLTWHLDPIDPDASAPQTFFLERTGPNGHLDDVFPILASPFEDTGLSTSKADPVAGTVEVYKYRVGRLLSSETGFPDWSSPVSHSTSLVSFGGENFLAAGGSGPVPAGCCLIERIEASQLAYHGTNVQIVLRGPSTGSLSIDRIYISKPGGAKPYDPDSDLTPVRTTPFVIGADQVVTLDVIDYLLDHNQPLLIAFDLSPAAAAQVKFLDNPPPPPGQVTTYHSPVAAAEAASPTRSANYSVVANRLCCIEVIGVGG